MSLLRRPAPPPDVRDLAELLAKLRVKIFRRILRRGAVPGSPIREMLAWPHAGFTLDYGTRIEAGDREGLRRLSMYLLRPSRCNLAPANRNPNRPRFPGARQLSLIENPQVVDYTKTMVNSASVGPLGRSLIAITVLLRRMKRPRATAALSVALALSACMAPIPRAAYRGDVEQMRQYLDQGGPVEYRRFDLVRLSRTTKLLCYAEWGGQVEIMKMLLDHGANIETQCDKGTSLCNAARHGEIEITQMLLDRAANIEAQCGDGTSLCNTARHGEVEIAKTLLDHKANIETKCYNGGAYWTPLVTAGIYGKRAVEELLIERGANLRGDDRWVLCFSASNGDVELIKMLLDHGADIEARCDNLRTPLVEAALYGRTAAVKLLLERGADYTATENRGFSAEHVAWRRSQTFDSTRANRKSYEETTKLIRDWIATHPTTKPYSAKPPDSLLGDFNGLIEAIPYRHR